MAQEVKTEDKELAEIKSRKMKKMASQTGEKEEMIAPAVSYQQLKDINISQSKQLAACQRILMDIAGQAHNQGLALLNMSDSIAKLFTPPEPQVQQGQPQQPPNS